jgi:hypothetical protein
MSENPDMGHPIFWVVRENSRFPTGMTERKTRASTTTEADPPPMAKDDKRWVGTPYGEGDSALELPAEEGGGGGESCSYAG